MAEHLDMFLGGPQEVPQSVKLLRFAASRSEEIAALMQTIEDPQKTGLVFQKLPRHMRRRATSHNAKRLPRRLREAHMKQMQKSGLPPKPKRPSRRYRRRPGNLLIEYNRRQRKHVWLETHIWHAKRFHMTERWGYKLANFPNDKSFRACYRATSQHCLIQDHSYFSAIELSGALENILSGLSTLTSSTCGPTFGAQAYLNGTREGSVMLYHKNTFPYGAIGSVTFLWKPEQEYEDSSIVPNAEENIRTIWMWVHPSFYEEVLQELIDVFDFVNVQSECEPVIPSDTECGELMGRKGKKKKNVEPSDTECGELKDRERKKKKNVEPSDTECGELKDRERKKKKNVEPSDTECGELKDRERKKKKNVEPSDTECGELKDREGKKKKNVEPSDTECGELKDREGKKKKNVEPSDTECGELKGREGKKKKKKDVEKNKLKPKNVPFVKTPKFTNGAVNMVLLKDTLNRFRLIGPLSQAVLCEVLKPSVLDAVVRTERINETGCRQGVKRSHKGEIKMETNGDVETENVPMSWWKRYLAENDFLLQSLEFQKKTWRGLTSVMSPAELPPHTVFALTVQDPRNFMPQKRSKALPSISEHVEATADLIRPSPTLAASALWNPYVRDAVTATKLSTAEFNELRSKHLVPGHTKEELLFSYQDPEMVHSQIPVILIQQPGSQDPVQKKIGYGSGWDIIVPAGWGMPFWLAFIFCSARAGGLREDESLALESGRGTWLNLAPDTLAGFEEGKRKQRELEEKHFRYPPAKRPNYIKFGTLSPFNFPWGMLLQDWLGGSVSTSASDQRDFYVLRDKKKIRVIQQAMQSKQVDIQSVKSTIVDEKCLIPVLVMLCGKGCLSDFATVSLPFQADIQEHQRDRSYVGPAEPVHKDGNANERKTLRMQHQKLLRRLQKKRKKEKERSEESTAETTESSFGQYSAKSISEAYSRKMKSLWLPEAKTFKDCCSRPIIGCLTEGRFCFTEACGVGFCFVTFPGLVQLLQSVHWNPKLLVLVRNNNSVQHRFAKLHIVH